MACQLLHTSGYSSVFLSAACEQTEFSLSCFKVYHKDYPLQPRHWLNISRECCILSRLQQERVDGIVQLWGVANTSQYISLRFKPCLGGNLYQALQRQECCDERELCAKVAIPLLHVLNSLHGRGIIHRDIKPENIFFEKDGKLVVGDFGLAIDSSQHKPCSRVGTPDYMAPEVFAQPSADVVALGQIPSSSLMPYGTAVDIWAVGTLVCEALTGMVPFYHPEPTVMALKMQYGRPHPLPLGTSHACQAFVDAALQKEASRRPTAAELLGHPWIQQHADAAAAMVATRVRNKVLAELKMDRSSTGSATQPGPSGNVADAASNSSSVIQGTSAKPVSNRSKPYVLPTDAQAAKAAVSKFGCGRHHDSSSSLCGGPCSHKEQGSALSSSAGTPQAPLVCSMVATQQPGAGPAQDIKTGNDDPNVAAGLWHRSTPQPAGHLRAHLTARAAGAASMPHDTSPPQHNNAHTAQSMSAGAFDARCCQDMCAIPAARSLNNQEEVQPVDAQLSWSAPGVMAASAACTVVQHTCKPGCCKSWCSSSTTAKLSSQYGPCSAPVDRTGSGSDQAAQAPVQEPMGLQHHALCCTTKAVQCSDQPVTASEPKRSSSSSHNQDTTATALSTSYDSAKHVLTSITARHHVPTAGNNREPFQGVAAHGEHVFANQGNTHPGSHRPPLLDPRKEEFSAQLALGASRSRLALTSPRKAGMLMQRLRRLGRECIAPRACSTRTARRYSFDVSGHARQGAGIAAASEANSSNACFTFGTAMDAPKPAPCATHHAPAETARLALSLGGAPPVATLNKLAGVVSPYSACKAAAAASVTSAVDCKHSGCPCHTSHASSARQAAQGLDGRHPCFSCCPEDPHAAPLPVRLTAPVGDLGVDACPESQRFCLGRQTASSDNTSTGQGRGAKGTYLKVLQHFLRP